MKDCSVLVHDTVSTLVFKEMGVSSIPILRRYFCKYPSRSCDFTIGGTLMWIDYFDYKYAEIDGTLIIMGRLPDEDSYLFYSPCGNMKGNHFRNLIRGYCLKNRISGYTLEPIESTPETQDLITFEKDDFVEDWKEYLYDIERFRTFSGKKMEKKRNHLNFFMNNYSPFTVETVTKDMIAGLISFTISFNSVHQDNGLANYECRQVIEVLRDLELYPFEGIALRKDGEIIGFTLGEKIGDTFFVHIEKGDVTMRGVYQAIASNLARYVTEKYPEVKYLNREEDMGDESLRKSKLSYHPSLFVNKKRTVVTP